MNTISLPEKQLQRLGVTAVYLFGSFAEKVAGDLSDIDIGVLLTDPRVLHDSRKLYQSLYDLFTNVFDVRGRSIDIVFLQAAPLELRFDVVQHGKLLYRQSDDIVDQFGHNTAMLYMDCKPMIDRFNQVVLDRI